MAAYLKVASLVLSGVVLAFQVYREIKSRSQRNQLLDSNATNATNANRCVVCLKDFVSFRAVLLPCSHKIHADCMVLLMSQSEKTCPRCRKNIS